MAQYRHDTGRSGLSTLPSPTGDARPAGFIRRAGGFVVDWLIAFFIPSLVSSLILVALSSTVGALVLDILWVLLLAVIVTGYFTIYAMRGQSPGMRVVGIRVLDPVTGQPPAAGRALVRGLLTALFCVSWLGLFVFGPTGVAAENGSTTSERVMLAFNTFALITSIGYLWMTWDRRRRTLQDQIAGLVVVRAEAARDDQGDPEHDVKRTGRQ